MDEALRGVGPSLPEISGRVKAPTSYPFLFSSSLKRWEGRCRGKQPENRLIVVRYLRGTRRRRFLPLGCGNAGRTPIGHGLVKAEKKKTFHRLAGFQELCSEQARLGPRGGGTAAATGTAAGGAPGMFAAARIRIRCHSHTPPAPCIGPPRRRLDPHSDRRQLKRRGRSSVAGRSPDRWRSQLRERR